MSSVATEHPPSSSQHTDDTLQLLTSDRRVTCCNICVKNTKFCQCGEKKVFNERNRATKCFDDTPASRRNYSIYRNTYFSQPTLWLYVGGILHKETGAVKLVFLQSVKEVTTDRADAAARYPTLIHDILYV